MNYQLANFTGEEGVDPVNLWEELDEGSTFKV